MNKITLANFRRDYSLRELSESSVDTNPFAQFSAWMGDAIKSEIIDATAMTLATVDKDCKPSSRVVLLKDFGENGFVFFTNYESKKAVDLADNPNAALHFFWAELERQVIIGGTVEKTSRDESEAYFKTRPFESRIGAWASKQSSVIESRRALEERVAELTEQYKDGSVPLPPFWGGYRLTPSSFEFWQGRASRLHDRICYRLREKEWEIFRLSP